MAQLSLLVLVSDPYVSLDFGRVSAAAVQQALLRGALTRVHRLTHLGSMLLKRAKTLALIFAAERLCLHILVRIVVLALILSDSVDFVRYVVCWGLAVAGVLEAPGHVADQSLLMGIGPTRTCKRMDPAHGERVRLPPITDVNGARSLRRREIAGCDRLLLRQAWGATVLVLLFDLSDPVGDGLLIVGERAEPHWNARLLLPVVDLDPHIGRWTLKHIIGERLLLLCVAPRTLVSGKVQVLLRRGQEAHVELGIRVDHLHLLAELGDVESLRGFNGRRSLKWEDRGLLRLHHSQAHHVISQVKAIILRCCSDLQLVAHVKIACHGGLFLLKSHRVIERIKLMIDDLARTIFDLHLISGVLVNTVLELPKRTIMAYLEIIVSLTLLSLTILDGDVQVLLNVHHLLHGVSSDLCGATCPK